ncbi:hypothetical protein [Streptomyces sp. NBC_01465]|uniref:hypothetical protein n=1 Tax=Streptomyces sp. NBC_01465 TaxID=2903878 RepID=UPI002E35BB40|nr:hypothetical protein [Streptomyces sp. NBC_01465]
MDEIRVQQMVRGDGGLSFTIVWPDGSVDEEADSFLRMYEGSGTQRTYAFTLVDHLRWRVREGLVTERVTVSRATVYRVLERARSASTDTPDDAAP